MSDTQLFEENKDFRLDFKLYQKSCAKDKIPMGNWAKQFDTARIIVSKDRTEGLIHVRTKTPINFNGEIMLQMGEPEAFLVRREWCQMVN